MICPKCDAAEIHGERKDPAPEMVERIDPASGGFLKCPECGHHIDTEDYEEW